MRLRNWHAWPIVYFVIVAIALWLSSSPQSSAQQGQGGAPIVCNKAKIYDASTSGATELVAAGPNIYVCGYTFYAAGTVNVSLVYGTGTACATGQTKLTPAYQFTTQTGVVDPSPYFRGMFVPSGNALCINTSAGVATQATVYYATN